MTRHTRLVCSVIASALLVPAIALAQERTGHSRLIAQHPDNRAANNHADAASSTDRHLAEASARFGLPERWIRAVIAAESAGNPRAVSSAGAMGLMQIMPATWAELRARYGLGADPFAPRGNILAGTAYLRELYDRFGLRGFLAAYNAGPDRYAEHLAIGRPLPRETRAYVAWLAPVIDGSRADQPSFDDRPIAQDWREATIFTERKNAVFMQPGSRAGHHSESAKPASDTSSATLFVPATSVRTP
jgi:hypothetical protein